MKKKINFCKICCYSDTHPLGLVINNNGVCTGCKIHQEKFEINWSDKYEKLKKIIKQYKSNKNIYDCVVPVSGGLDSYYIVEQVTKLGLKPLLVNYNKYFNTPLGIKNLSHLKTIFDLDLLTLNVNPNSIKKISKFTLVNYGNIYWHIIAGQTVFPIKIAIKYKIPLIIWGAHQGVEQVGMYSHHNEVEMSRFYRKNHDLFGVEAENLIENSNSINASDLESCSRYNSRCSGNQTIILGGQYITEYYLRPDEIRISVWNPSPEYKNHHVWGCFNLNRGGNIYTWNTEKYFQGPAWGNENTRITGDNGERLSMCGQVGGVGE